MITINKALLKSTTFFKVVLFIFLGIAHLQSRAQCPPTFTVTTTSATNYSTNDGQITVIVDASAVGPFDFYLTDMTSALLQSSLGQSSGTCIFTNIASGNYIVNVWNYECTPIGTNIDTISVFPVVGGTITYSGFMGYCGSSGSNIIAYADSNGCGSSIPPVNQFILTDISGTLVDSSVLISNSISYSGLMANQYILQIINLYNNCTSVDTFTISANALQSTVNSINPSSATSIDGSITVNVIGGTPPYNIGVNGSSIPGWQNGDSILGLSEGIYTLWVIDATGCFVQDTVQLIYNNCTATLATIGTCSPLTLSAQTTNIVFAPYNYTYNLYHEGILVQVFQSNLDSILFNTMVSDSGQYVLQVVNDSTGCISSDTLDLNLNTMSINLVTPIINPSSQVACNGQISIEVLVNGNQPLGFPPLPFTLEWDTAGVVFDSTTSPNNTSNQFWLCENTYCLNVTDASGCTISECFDVLFTPCNTSLFVSDSIDCNEGIGALTATIDTAGGGVGPNTFVNRYTYTLYSANPQVQIGPNQYTNNLSITYPGLPAGFYLVSVYDSSYGTSCSSDSIPLIEPDPINIYTTADSTSAPWIEDGVITIDSITGGTQPYIITWLDSVGNPLPTSGILVQDSLGYSNQYNGGYTIQVIDTNGCTGSTTIYIHPNNAAANLSVDSVGVDHVSCYGACDGRLYMAPLNVGPGSVAPFTYIWIDVDGSMPGLNPGDTMRVDSCCPNTPWYTGAPSHVATYTNRCAGTYNLFAFDYYGNPFPSGFFPITFTVNQPDSIGLDLGPDIVIDCGEDTVLTAHAFGGNKTNDTTLINSFILDFNNPSGIGDTLVTGGNYLLVVSGTFRHDTSLVDHLDAAYDYSVTPPSEIMLWNFDGTNTHRPSPNIYQTSHTYSFTFTGGNAGGIPGMGVHTWSVPSSAYSGQLSCDLYAIDTGIYLYNYNWTSIPPSVPAIISDEDTCYMYPGLTPTDYIVTVMDSEGCTDADTVNVMWDLYILNFDSINTTDVVPCYGDATGTVNVSVDSSTGFNPYTYFVLDQTGSTINSVPVSDTTFNLIAGDYVLYLQDNIGCLSENDTITINQPDSIWACGVGNLNSQFLIDNFVMDFDTISTAFTHTIPVPTLFGVNYLLVVNGTYGLDFFNSNHKDPAFIIASGVASNDWTVNGVTIRPDNDVYSNTHQYSYTFAGNGNATSFGFIDPNGTYNNNAGSLTFTLYKLGCANTDTVYTCSGDSTGYSSISATGGAPFDPDGIANSGDEYYNFTWTDASGVDWTNYSVTNGIISNISGIPAGDYTVNIIDANGCSGYERYLKVLEAPTPLVIDSTDIFDVLCFGQETAEVTAYFSGGFTPYFTVLTHINGSSIDTIYQSINDIDSVSIDSLTYGSYTLYIYDSLPDNLNGTYFCPQEFNFSINQPQSPLSSSVNLLSHVSCWGDSTGKAKVIASGGNSLHPYSYLWDNGETTDIADSLWADVNLSWPSPQWQGVTITDSNGCTHRDSIQIQHLNEEIQAYNTLDGSNTVQVIQNVQCFNACDAIVTVSSVGGILPHIYFWDIGNVGHFMPDTTTGVCFGGHDIIIEDQVGCRKTVYYQIDQPDELFTDAHWVDHIDCYGYNNGIAHAFATGGTTPYTFVWDSLTGQQNDTAYNLTPGIHTVYVIDDKGCMASDTVLITEPAELTIAIQDTSTVYSYCTGTNSAYLYSIASGGIEPYNYVWSDVLGQTTQWADDLTAGIYTVTVLDDRGCSASDTRNIDSVTGNMQASTSVTNVSCFGLFDGSTFVNNVDSMVPFNNNPLNDPIDPPYIFSWTYPGGAIVTQQQINFLYAGNYGVTITDSNNCSITIYTDVEEPNQLEYTLYDITGSTCYGSCDGSISVDVQGGTSPYSWDGDMLGPGTPFINPVSLINDSLILDLCAGDYDIYVTDANDCIGTVVWGGVWQATIDPGVVVSIDPPNVTQPASCYNTNDGHANVIFPINYTYSYTWETLSGVVVDTGTHTTILSGGDYNLVAHYADSANFGQVYTACDASVTFTMPSPLEITPPPNYITNELSCYDYTYANGLADGEINLETGPGVTGGDGGPYTYQWDTTTSVSNGSTDAFIDSLQAGTYTVTITDGMGCTQTIAFVITEPDQLTNNFDPVVNPSCNGDNDGSITANPSGGTSPYSYSWQNSNGNNIPGGQTANNLFADNYTLIVEDGNSCPDTFYVSINEPDLLISTVDATSYYGNNVNGDSLHIRCNGGSNGSAIVNLGGGTAPYSFSWEDASGTEVSTNQNTDTILLAGDYTVDVIDANGCLGTQTITLKEPDLLVVNGTSTGNSSSFPGGFDISCKGLNDGECYADPIGGVKWNGGIYKYDWSGPFTGQVSNDSLITDLYVGTYSVTVTDANGCTDVQTFILTEPTEEFISETHLVNYAGASVSPVTADFQDNTVSVDQYDYTFYWPIGDSIDVINVTNLTDFQELSFMEIGENEVYIKVQNMNSGCIDDTTFIIEVQGIPEIHNVFTPNGDGINDYFDFGEFAMKDIDVSIYSRWGEMVTNWQEANYQWDGRGIDGEDLPEGVYYYVLIATGEDGHSYQKKGSITLLR